MKDLFFARKCADCKSWSPKNPAYTIEKRLEENPRPGERGNCGEAIKPDTTILHEGGYYNSVEEVRQRRKKPFHARTHITSAQSECNVTEGVDGPYCYSPLKSK